MNKEAYVDLLATKFDLTKVKAREIVNSILDATSDALKNGQNISIVGFGSLKVKDVAKRNGHNPQTGKSIVIPAHKQIHFKAGNTLKNSVNE